LTVACSHSLLKPKMLSIVSKMCPNPGGELLKLGFLVSCELTFGAIFKHSITKM